MKKLSVVLAIALVLAVCDHGMAARRIGVVDVARVVKECNEGMRANAELDAMVAVTQVELKKKADTIEMLKKNLALAPAETKASREEEIARAEAEYKKSFAAYDEEIRKRGNELRSIFIERIKKIVDSIGHKEKFLIILPTDNPLYFDKMIDISDRVIREYNKSRRGK